MSTFREQIAVFTGGLGPLASEALAKAAHSTEDQIVAEQSGRNGIAPGVTTAVDGEQGKAFEDVRPDGTIYLGFDYRAEVVKVCFDELRARSPRVTGSYADSHYAILDGQALPPLTVPTSEQLGTVGTIIVTNPQLYARKLEIAKDRDGTPFVKQVSPHIFEGAMLAVRRKYSSVARIEFNFVDLGNGIIHRSATWRDIRAFTSGAKSRGSVRRSLAVAATRNPAIIITRT